MALRILLADDSMTAQNMGKKILADAGYEVVTVSNGAAAVKKIAEISPDLAILDVYMPGYSGLEVCERVKMSPGSIPVLLTVGKMEPFRPEDGMKVKADGVIIKPFEATDLITVVGKLCERIGRVPPTVASSESSAPAPWPQAEPEELSSPSVQHFESSSDFDDSVEAPGLQTFTPANDPLEFQSESAVQFTSLQTPGEIPVETPAAFEPTSTEDPEPLGNKAAAGPDSPDSALMHGFGATPKPTGALDVAMDETIGLGPDFAAFGEHDSEPEGAPDLPRVESTVEPATENIADVPVLEVAFTEESLPAPEWNADEAEITEQDLALDLEAEMHAAAAQVPTTENEIVLTDAASIGEEPELHAAAAAANFAGYVQPLQSAAENARPLPAPLGKTSFDELDAIMDEAATRFENSESLAVSAEPAEIAGFEPQPQPLLDDDLALELEPADLAPVATEGAVADALPESALFESELLVEEQEEASPWPSAPSMHSADSLSGVFEIDPPAELTENSTEELPAAEPMPHMADITIVPAFENEATPADPVDLAVCESEPAAEVVPLTIDDTAPADHQEHELVAEPFIHDAGELSLAAEPALVEVVPAALPQVMVESAEHCPAPANVEAVAADHASPELVEKVVERVVERVMERIRPMIVVVVEEILREFKQK